MGGVRMGGGPYAREHCIGPIQNLVVSETKHREPLTDEPGVSTRIRIFGDGMNSAIDLDDETM